MGESVYDANEADSTVLIAAINVILEVVANDVLTGIPSGCDLIDILIIS